MNKSGNQKRESLEKRVARLEQRLGLPTSTRSAPSVLDAYRYHPMLPLGLGLVVLVCGYLGLGLPQHYYQPLFAGLVVALAYHRKLWLIPAGHWRWAQGIVNFLILALFFKLLIGGGRGYPLSWLRVPVIKKVPRGQETPWYDQLFPQFDIEWQGIPAVTDVSFDITMIQTFLLIATLAGAMFRFQPFASLTAVILLLVSIPTFVSFNWEWVVWFLVLGGVCFYLQAQPFSARSGRAAAE